LVRLIKAWLGLVRFSKALLGLVRLSKVLIMFLGSFDKLLIAMLSQHYVFCYLEDWKTGNIDKSWRDEKDNTIILKKIRQTFLFVMHYSC
jgi:hypothetical protein